MKKIISFFFVLSLCFIGLSQGHETFDSIPTHSPVNSYADGTFTGKDGSTWTYYKVRTDALASVNTGDKAAMLGRNKSSELYSGTIHYGIDSLQFLYKQAFGTNVNLEVYINDILVYTATSNNEQNIVKSSGVIDVSYLNFTGDFVIKFKNPGDNGQVNIDDIIWAPSSQVCVPPSNIAVNSIDDESATISWSAGYNENEWAIVYGPSGFDINAYQQNPLDPSFSNVNTVLVSNNPSTISGLDANTQYDVYVMSKCDLTTFSEVVGPKTFTTLDVCLEPTNVLVSNIGENVANLSWTAGGNETVWIIIVGPSGFDVQDYIDNGNSSVTSDTTSNNPYSIGGLNPETGYDIYVLAKCGEGDNSNPVGPESFTTNMATCEVPTSLTKANLTINSVKVSWTSNGNETEWVVIVGPSGFDVQDYIDNGNPAVTSDTTSNNPYSIGGLTPETGYDIYVLAKCAENNYSDPAGPLNFTTPAEGTCETPSNLGVAEITGTTAKISWDAAGNETEWEIIYGPKGFDFQNYIDNGSSAVTSQVVSSNPFEITLLNSDTEYDVYVRAKCDNDYSLPLGPSSFKTDESSSISKNVFEGFKMYPNPVSDQLNINSGAIIEKAEVYNILGESITTVYPNALETQIDTKGIQRGIYLIKVTINGNHKTFRVVKK